MNEDFDSKSFVSVVDICLPVWFISSFHYLLNSFKILFKVALYDIIDKHNFSRKINCHLISCML